MAGFFTPSTIWMGQFWAILICTPALYTFTRSRGLFNWAYCALTHYIAYKYTDSVGSAWCLISCGLSIVYMIDYMCFDSVDDAYDAEQLKLAKLAKEKTDKV